MKHLLFILLLASLFSGCVKNNPDPSWITINKWTLVANTGGDDAGELTHNFPYAWVYVNNKIIGVFELPCTIPVLTSGAAEIKVYPAILNNGISASKKIYPFVEFQTYYPNLVQNEVFEINPVTRYITDAKFLIQDFESANIGITETGNSIATMLKVTTPNNSYGKVFLNASQNYWEAYWNAAINLTAGKEAYLEIDYYNTNDVTQGVQYEKADGSTASQVNIQLNAQDDNTVVWKKIYIDLKEIVGVSQGVYFLQTFQTYLDDGDSEGLIYFDNLKIVHY